MGIKRSVMQFQTIGCCNLYRKDRATLQNYNYHPFAATGMYYELCRIGLSNLYMKFIGIVHQAKGNIRITVHWSIEFVKKAP